MYIRKNHPVDFSARKYNNNIIEISLDLNSHKEIKILSRVLENVDTIKKRSLFNDATFVLKPEQNNHALGLHNTTELMLNRIEPLIKRPGYRELLEDFHKALQEFKIKFLLKSIIESPIDWEDYDLNCEIYDGIINYYHSARCTLSQCYLIHQNIALEHIQKFLGGFKYNFAYNLTYQAVPATGDLNNFHYYSIMGDLTAQGLDEDLCHKIANIRNARRICLESFRESDTPGEENKALLTHLKEKTGFIMNNPQIIHNL